MITSRQELTRDMIFYSVCVSDFEKLDFKNDALAGVRANYFNSNHRPQADDTDILLDDVSYKLSYKMSKNQPLSWKVTKNLRPYQSVKRETGGIYCVRYYTENATVYKKQFFDSSHLWIRTEYFDKSIEGERLCTVSPKKIDDVIVIEKITFSNNRKVGSETLFPSDKNSDGNSAALVYSNNGMIWYDSSFVPKYSVKEESKENTVSEPKPSRFELEADKFLPDYSPENPIDLSSLEYLEDTFKEPQPQITAYDRIEKILEEAHKTNKNLFGQIIENTCVEIADEETELLDDSEEITEENMAESKAESKAEISEKTQQASDTEEHTEESETTQEVREDIVKAEEEKKSDAVVSTTSGNYKYFGAVDENGLRTGRGRTVSPSGITAYDGEYAQGKRDGFGVFYYKNGDINYVGEWAQNRRSGAGVGYRTSDGTMHIGKWDSNTPCGYGARFNKDGTFIDVADYANGVKNGKCISLDENGNFYISIWENGKKISEHIIEW
jgi:antitoxin component YwqK of YwqJK toxin-antitoxin module